MSTETRDRLQVTYRDRFYNRYLQRRDGNATKSRGGLHRADPYLKQIIKKYLPKDRNTRIVDLGCGCGELLLCLKSSGYINLEGVDCSPEQVEGAHEAGLSLVEQGDIMEYLAARRGCSYDVVFAFDVIEHVSKDEAVTFSDEVFRVLRPGGLFIVHTPNGEGIFSGSAFGDFTHELILTRKSLGQLLRCSGFADVATFEDVPVVHGIMSAGRFLVWKIFKAFMSVGYAAETGYIGRDLIFTQNFLAVARK